MDPAVQVSDLWPHECSEMFWCGDIVKGWIVCSFVIPTELLRIDPELLYGLESACDDGSHMTLSYSLTDGLMKILKWTNLQKNIFHTEIVF